MEPGVHLSTCCNGTRAVPKDTRTGRAPSRKRTSVADPRGPGSEVVSERLPVSVIRFYLLPRFRVRTVFHCVAASGAPYRCACEEFLASLAVRCGRDAFP